MKKIVIITGAAGSGKTTEMEKYFRDPEWTPLYHDIWSKSFPNVFVEILIGKLNLTKEEILEASRKNPFIGNQVRNYYILYFLAYLWEVSQKPEIENLAVEMPFYTEECRLLVEEFKKSGIEVTVIEKHESLPVLIDRLKNRGWSNERIENYLEIYPQYFKGLNI